MYNARLSRAALLAALLIAGPALATAQAQGDSPVEPGQTFTGTVVTVTDGDTYDLRRSIGGKATVRLHSIDAPESTQSYGRAATRAARYITEKKSVRVVARGP
jgi:endonuclease YncB( thermonuclease family)